MFGCTSSPHLRAPSPPRGLAAGRAAPPSRARILVQPQWKTGCLSLSNSSDYRNTFLSALKQKNYSRKIRVGGGRRGPRGVKWWWKET